MALGRLPICLYAIHLVAAQPVKYALAGQKGHLTPEVQASSGQIQILWKHNGDKVVDFNGQEETVFPPYTDRVTLDWQTAALEVSGLRHEDGGVYELEVYRNRKLERSSFHLQVLDKVSKPTVSCEILTGDADSAGSGRRARLMCSAEPGRSEALMAFQWRARAIVHPGPNLTVPLGEQHDDEEYVCNVTNPLSAEMTTFVARDCHPAANSTAIVVGVCVSIAAIVLVVGLLWFFKRKRKPGSEETRTHPEEESLVSRQATVPSPQRLAGLDPNSDDVESTGNQPEHRGEGRDPDRRVPSDRKPAFQSPRRLAPVTPRSDESWSEENAAVSKNDADKIDKTPGHPGNVCTSPSARPWSPSAPNLSDPRLEGNQKEANLTQVSGELAQITAGESDLKEQNQLDTNVNHPEPPSPERQQEIATHQQNPERKDSRTSSVGQSKDANDDDITCEQLNIPNHSQPEESLPKMLSRSPNVAATEVGDQSETDNTASDSDSDNCDKDIGEEKESPASQEQDQVTERPQVGEADSKTKDLEEGLPPYGAERASAGGQTPEQGEKESQSAEANEQAEEESDGEDKKEKNQQPQSPYDLKQENRDPAAPDPSTAAAPSQEDNPRQSESSCEAAGRGGGGGKKEQAEDDASEHEDKENSDQDSGKCHSCSEAENESTDSTGKSHKESAE